MNYDLTRTKVLSFDVYATLIDWEAGIFQQLSPLLGRLPPQSRHWGNSIKQMKDFLLGQFAYHESQIKTKNPKMIYSIVLSQIYMRLASTLEVAVTEKEANAFGHGIGGWHAYPDTVNALLRLKKFYKLVALSNCDRVSFSKTTSGPLKAVKFDAIYLAEDIGSYKPDLNNFRYLTEHVKSDFGFDKDQITHTAQSLSHDHVPAKTFGLPPSVWISRGARADNSMGGELKDYEDKINLGAIYTTLGDMADAVEKAFAAQN